MKILRILLVAVVSVFALGVSIASAQPPETFTNHEHGLVESFSDIFPSCDSEVPYQITTVSNLVEHETVFGDGRGHFTFTQTGTFTATPIGNPTLPDASGHFTIWGGFNANSKTLNGTFTFSIRGMTEDGERINFHFTEHFNERPNGSVNEFFRCMD